VWSCQALAWHVDRGNLTNIQRKTAPFQGRK